MEKNLSVEFIFNSLSKIENIKNLIINEDQKEYFSIMPNLNFIKHYENLYAFNNNITIQNNKKNYLF